jgi:hypothetical protein
VQELQDEAAGRFRRRFVQDGNHDDLLAMRAGDDGAF